MTGRYLVLPLGAALVLALGVYLFVAVRAEPAPPQIAVPGKGPAPVIASAEPGAVPAPPPSAGHAVDATPPGVPASAPDLPAAPDPAAAGGDATANDAKLDTVMSEANKAYDRGDLEDAKTIASRVLLRQPANARMLRILVSASCIDGDAAAAQTAFLRLPPGDQEQMRVRCSRYGIALSDKPADR